MERNNVERQSEILQIGHAVDMEVSEIKKWIGESTKSVRAQMCKQSETAFIMDFTMTDGAYDRMMAEIGRLGRVTSAVKITTEEQFIEKRSDPHRVDLPHDRIFPFSDDSEEEDQDNLQSGELGTQTWRVLNHTMYSLSNMILLTHSR